ncbi:hypothetical protein QF044_001271 [Chryseobacterium sp. W4I1]|nr:hypothetical protein [Chryseobacterium sp. W4I1]
MVPGGQLFKLTVNDAGLHQLLYQVKPDIVRVIESEMERITRTSGFTAFGVTGIKNQEIMSLHTTILSHFSSNSFFRRSNSFLYMVFFLVPK